MIDLRHPLTVLASRMPWQAIEARVAQVFSRKGHAGVAMPDLGAPLCPTTPGAYACRLRIMIALLYLKHAFNESDEGVMARWADTPRWQFFGGCAYYEDRQPCDPSTLACNVVLGARAFHGNPYDGHTLNQQLEQATILTQDSAAKPVKAFVDLAYQGVEAENPAVHIVHRGKARGISEPDRRQLKRRQAIEPIIGHLKSDHGMDRCHLKGETGDRLHAVLRAAGYNLKWLLHIIARKGIAFLEAVMLRLQQALARGRAWLGSAFAVTIGGMQCHGCQPATHAFWRWPPVDGKAA